ncbi:MAG: RNA polymerase sigma factor [Anaerolineae bacterium]
MPEGKTEALRESEDAYLLAQARRGNMRAFEALYHKYKNLVYRAALAVTRDSEAAEDILQDCFLRLHAHVDSLDGSYPIGPWLYRVTVNLCYNWASRQRPQASDEEALEEVHNPRQALPEAAFERHELRAAVEEALQHLSLNHRLVIVLFYLGGFSLEEIARILDCPVGTVKSRLHYARLRLRDLLAEGEGQPAVEARHGVRG